MRGGESGTRKLTKSHPLVPEREAGIPGKLEPYTRERGGESEACDEEDGM